MLTSGLDWPVASRDPLVRCPHNFTVYPKTLTGGLSAESDKTSFSALGGFAVLAVSWSGPIRCRDAWSPGFSGRAEESDNGDVYTILQQVHRRPCVGRC